MQGAPPFSYLGFDVLAWVPDGIQGKSGSWETPLERLDVPSGAFAVTAPALHPIHGAKMIYRSHSRDTDHAPLWTWIQSRLGRLTPFWCPTFQRDMDVVGLTLGTLTVTAVGYAARFAVDPSAKYLYVFNDNGANAVTVLVTGVVNNGDGTETITYSTSVGEIGSTGSAVAILLAADGISMLLFSRLGEDAVTQQFYTTELIDTELAVTSILNEQP